MNQEKTSAIRNTNVFRFAPCVRPWFPSNNTTFAFGLDVESATNCLFFTNTFTVNLTSNIGPSGLGPFPFNAGIAVLWGTSNSFYSNILTEYPAGYATNYYGIGLFSSWLQVNSSDNIINFTNNTFSNYGLGVFAAGYPIYGANNPPNTWSTNIESRINNGYTLSHSKPIRA